MTDDDQTDRTALDLPAALTSAARSFPTVFVKPALGPDGVAGHASLDAALYAALEYVCARPLSGQALIKVHIGEPSCATRIRPEHVAGAVRFLRDAGLARIAAGDTTVAYTGMRGTRQNPPGDATEYLQLADRHGWRRDGPAGVPFVVLDRPSTCAEDGLVFERQECRNEVAGINRFGDFWPAGGFAAADFVLNFAHLTLHQLAGVAGCVKGLAMGCSGLTGKLRMHQSLLPRFDPDLCTGCGRCVKSCPENALTLEPGARHPDLDPGSCIGCGECQALCARDAVWLEGEEISDWQRGRDTLSLRMADCVLGLMNGRWDRVVHVLHMRAITKLCDCVDAEQKPLVQQDLGLLVGRNPFAIDRLGANILRAQLDRQQLREEEDVLNAAEQTAHYVEEAYGIQSATRVERLLLDEGMTVLRPITG